MQHPAHRIVILLLATAACSGGSGGSPPPLPTPLAQLYAIDGVFDLPTILANADATSGSATLEYVGGLGSGAPTGKMTTASWAFRNDDRDLYIAVEWNDASNNFGWDNTTGPLDFDGVKLLFDEDGDGTYALGEDARTVIAASIASKYVDQHGAAGDETDVIADGLAALNYDAGTMLYRAEFLIPLADDASGEDGPLTTTTKFNLVFYDHVEIAKSSGGIASVSPGASPGADASTWAPLPLSQAGPHAHPVIPSLGGLVVVISGHEEPNGEIYTFDPATRVVTRVTTLPTMFKENVSLSHDRTKIAFHAATSKTAYSSYEIWVVDVDGSNLRQLTSNSILDGHPGWSPDDRTICYASFREPGKASIVLMTAAGVELADLTSAGIDDNDPDYLPDGRIVFKTDRFSTAPEVRIAVMNANGNNVMQLTTLTGVSDHDGIGADGIVLFERFPKNTDYSTDPVAGFTPWHIVEIGIDGTNERTLLADRWINWLPDLGPTRNYICYLRSAGHTEARLMTRDGRDLGRWIPGMSQLRYIDWK